MLRTDWAIGRAASAFAGSKSHPVTASDFCPWPKEEEQAPSFEALGALIKGVAANNRNK